MARYTKQIRKRRQRTKKLKNARRTKRYKIKWGGLGANDQENIGITDRWSFTDSQLAGGPTKEQMKQDFEIYIFGSREHAELWRQIMNACKDKDEEINFYILTSGNKVSIIRTLQLLELDHLVEEVLCVNMSPVSNPENSKDMKREAFKGKMKYEVIRSIMEGHYGPKISGIKKVSGAFIDDDDGNGVTEEYCRTIEFIHATGSVDPTLNTDNPYRTMCTEITPDMSKKIYESPNIVDIGLLKTLLDKINTSYQSCVFSDFDRTLSANNGTLPFHKEEFKTEFFTRFNVTVTPIPPK